MTTVRIIRMQVASQGRPESCVNALGWTHQQTCKIQACVDYYKRLSANTRAEQTHDESVRG